MKKETGGWGICTVSSFRIAFLTKYYEHDEITEGGMSKACSMYGGNVNCIQGPVWKGNAESDHLDNLEVAENLSTWILNKLDGRAWVRHIWVRISGKGQYLRTRERRN